MERPYAKWIFGSFQHQHLQHSRHQQHIVVGNSSSSIAQQKQPSKFLSPTIDRSNRHHHRSKRWWISFSSLLFYPHRVQSRRRSNLNIFMVVTTICIMIVSAGVSVSSANTPSALASAAAAGSSSSTGAFSGEREHQQHHQYGSRRESRDDNNNNNNNGRSSSSNPYQHQHHHHHQQEQNPDISYNGDWSGGGGGDGYGSTNPVAYWTSVTHHYNSYITHPNYHFSSSSSSSVSGGPGSGSSPYNNHNNNNNYNGHNYNFGVLLNSDNEASTALFLNASTPATPADKRNHHGKNNNKGSESVAGAGESSGGSNNSNSTSDTRPSSKYTLFQQILIAWGATCLGLLTVVGNILVMISFKIDKQLQTISNYFLFSLAVADFLIGTIGMPLTTVYLLAGYWPFGERVCDAWLAVDYLTSNASVLNLLMISFDRYFSVTRPLTYRAKRTTKRAAAMISAAWGISLLLWPPWIYAWPYIEGKRTVPEYKCYIQFIETNQTITFGTAIAAFYIPVSIMLFLYYRIYMETEKRQRDLSQLQAGKKESSRRSNSSDEAMDVEEWKRMRSGSCICQDHLDQSPACPAHKRQSAFVQWLSKRWNCLARACDAFIGFCRVDRDADDPDEQEEEHASPGCGTPASIETPLQSSVSRCTSLNVIRDPLAQTPTRRNDGVISPVQTQSSNASQVVATAAPTTSSAAEPTTTTASSVTTTNNPAANPASGSGSETPQKSNTTCKPTNAASSTANPTPIKDGSNGKLPTSESVYTILIRIPGETEGKNASIRMIQEPGPLPPPPVPGHHQRAKTLSSNPESVYSSGSSASAGTGSAGGGGAGGSGSGGSGSVGGQARRPSSAAPPLHAKLIPKPLTSKGSAGAISATSVLPGQAKRKKKKNQEKKQEKKAAKTLSAILLAFIVTWTPYNILVLLKTIMSDSAIPEILWDASYYLCYINSTINPMCYALCNASFRRTYIRILTCKWENTRRQAVQRGYYN